MSEVEFEQKVEKANEIMQKHELVALDDYFTDIYMTKNHEHIFRVKHQRFYESKIESEEILDEILRNLIEYDVSQILLKS